MNNQVAVPNSSWYDDWKLSVGRTSGGGEFIRLELPHAPKKQSYYIAGNTVEIESMANVLDKLLSELTHTEVKEVIIDGPSEPAGP